MEKFNSQLKEFCQLTIDLIDIREKRILNSKSNLLEKENELFEKTLKLIKKLTLVSESFIKKLSENRIFLL